MNNNLKHLLRYFLLFLIAFPLASCGDDDDTNDPQGESICRHYNHIPG